MSAAQHLDEFARTHFHGLFAIVLLVALGLRLPALSTPSLNDGEAREAFAALDVAGGHAAREGMVDSAAYAALSALAFAVAGASTASARFWPAAAGVALAAVPILLRKKLGPAVALGAGLLLALSPTTAALSRTADGSIIGALGYAALLAALYSGEAEVRPWLTGIIVGIMLAAGPVGLGGLMVILATAAIEHAAAGRLWGRELSSGAWRQVRSVIAAPLFWAGILTAALVSSTALVYPGALGVLGQGLTAWVRSFVFIGQTGVVRALLLVLAYETLSVAYALPALRSFFKRPDLGPFIPLAAGAGAIYLLARPGRTPGDALLIAIPVMILAAVGIREMLNLLSRETVSGVIVLEVALILGLGVFANQSLTAYAVQPDLPTYAGLRLALGGVAILGIFLVAGLFATGWSGNVPGAVGGLGVGLAVLLLFGEVSAVWGVSFARRASANELWWESTSPRELNLLVSTVGEISTRQTGTPDELPLVVQGERESALGWAFRQFEYVEFVDQPARTTAPAVFIAPLIGVAGSEAMPSLAANYVGQRLMVRERRDWTQLPPEPVGWWLDRMGAVLREGVILWVREDVQFPPSQS
jgi:hypothetical protein